MNHRVAAARASSEKELDATRSTDLRLHQLGAAAAAVQDVSEVLATLGSDPTNGLSTAEVRSRTAQFGSNAVSSHRARLLPVLWHQLRSPLLVLLLAAALASYLVGEKSDAVIIGVIVAMSVGLGLVNEYRAEKAADALHAQISHRAVAVRDARAVLWTSRSWCPAT